AESNFPASASAIAHITCSASLIPPTPKSHPKQTREVGPGSGHTRAGSIRHDHVDEPRERGAGEQNRQLQPVPRTPAAHARTEWVHLFPFSGPSEDRPTHYLRGADRVWGATTVPSLRV